MFRKNRYFRNTKKFTSSLSIMLAAESIAHSSQPEEIYRLIGNSIEISSATQVHACKLDQTPQYALASFDNSALMVSQRGYVPIEKLETCNPAIPVHVSLIPDRTGTLSDINISRNIYVALDFVNVQPFLYLATVAHIGSSKNLVTLDGSYVRGRSLSKLKRHAFGGSGDAGTAIISPDGRFVAPAGQIDCRSDAAPGVWDVEKNKRMVTDREACAALFSLNERE
jgi:hypothetical protein